MTSGQRARGRHPARRPRRRRPGYRDRARRPGWIQRAAGPRATPKGRRDLSVSKLPRVLVEILDEEREASGCRRIGFEDSRQLMFRRGGFAILVKRVAKYEVIRDGETTVEAVPSPRRDPGETAAIGASSAAEQGPGAPDTGSAPTPGDRPRAR